jgi:hypothetical protein
MSKYIKVATCGGGDTAERNRGLDTYHWFDKNDVFL